MKRSQSFLLFYIGAPLLLAARVLQRFYMIDAETGYYRDGLSAAGAAVTALFIAYPLVALLLCRLSRPAERRFPDRSVPLAAGAFFAGVCLASEAMYVVLTAGGAAEYAVAFLSAVFAVCLILRGLEALNVLTCPDLLAPVGTVYAIIRLVDRFADYTPEVAVADTVLDILTMCLLLLFLHADGKWKAGLADERVAVSFFAFGTAGALCCAGVVVPDLIDLALGGKFVLYGGALPDLSYLGLAAYILCAVFTAVPPLDKNGRA